MFLLDDDLRSKRGGGFGESNREERAEYRGLGD